LLVESRLLSKPNYHWRQRPEASKTIPLEKEPAVSLEVTGSKGREPLLDDQRFLGGYESVSRWKDW
jgi:hypothetical protein